MPPITLYQLVQQRLSQDPELLVLFCFDASGSYRNPADAWLLENNVELIELEKVNQLELKFRLSLEIPSRPIFVYSGLPKPAGDAWERWPFLDSYFAGAELILDENALFIENHGLSQSLHLNLVRKYRPHLERNGKQVIFLEPILNPAAFTVEGIGRALLGLALQESASLSSLPGWDLLLGHLLVALADGDFKAEDLLKALPGEELQKEFVRECRYFLGVEPPMKDLTDQNLLQWVRQIKYLAIRPPAEEPTDPYRKRLFGKNPLPTPGLLAQTLSTWNQHASLNEPLQRVWDIYTADVKESELIKAYGIEASYFNYTPGLATALLLEIAGMAASQESAPPYPEAIQAEHILQKLGPSLRDILHSDNRNLGRFVGSALLVLSSIPVDSALILNIPTSYVETYANRWFSIDQQYRKACLAFQEIPVEYESDSRVSALNKKLQQAYLRFERDLNKAWLQAVKESGWNWPTGSFLSNPSFFEYTENNMKAKTVIIISDGFRYEVARQLESILNKDSLYEPDLQPMLSLPPTRTNAGMARLLPQGKRVMLSINAEGKLVSTIDKRTTEGLDSRLAFIASHKPESNYFAIQAAELIEASQATVREWFRNHTILYVYHDVIDKVADKKASETSLPKLCEEAVKDLERLCKKLTSGNFTRVIITADHGFLYQHQDPDSSDRVPVPELKDIASAGYRYMLAPAQEAPAHILSFPSGIEDNYGKALDMFVPLDSRRFKSKGTGMRYAHGGVSLQEMVTPYLTVYRRETAAKEKVAVRLQPPASIRSNSFKIRIDQLMPVDAQYKSRKVSVRVSLPDGLTSAAAQKEVTMDTTSSLLSQRSKELSFNLFSNIQGVDELVISMFDSEDLHLPLEEVRVPTNIVIATDFE